MSSPVRRAGAFAGVGTLALVAPIDERVATALFAVVALAAAFVTDGPVFELFARPGDHRDERLKGLVGFSVAAVVLGFLTSFTGLTVQVFAGSIVLYAYGNLAAELGRSYGDGPFADAAGFVVGGLLAGISAQYIALVLAGSPLPHASQIVVMATCGALVGALIRTVLLGRDDPPVILSIGLLLWLLSEVTVTPSTVDVAIALVVTVAVGYLSYALETASVEGMLTGVFLAFVAIVLGGYAWFAVMIAFFGIGGLSTKYRFEEKQARGVAEGNDGARGSANVLGNATVALASVFGYAAADAGLIDIAPLLFLFAFAGSLSTALADTLSSEIGSVFDDPRLITTFKRVEPGTDGAVTWQGELAGGIGAGTIGLLTGLLFASIGTTGSIVVVVAGIAGMTVDSLVGATLEGTYLANQSVNFLATLSGGLVGVGLAIGLALV